MKQMILEHTKLKFPRSFVKVAPPTIVDLTTSSILLSLKKFDNDKPLLHLAENLDNGIIVVSP